MEPKRSWWQYIRQHPFIVAGIIVVVFALMAFAIGVIKFGWSGTGFLNKTLWDWLQLLIIPLALAVVALLFNFANTRTEQKIATQRYEQDQKIALDKQREDLLQVYLDRMSELLLKEKLRSSAVDAEVRNVARVRTITILFQLDARRIGYVFAFLREAGLHTTKSNNIVSLERADLSAINLSQANLSRVNLSSANLSSANLGRANLGKANLFGADLNEANLKRVNLLEANLIGANLIGADLSNANLSEADLRIAKISRAILSGTNLSGANLSSADLIGANLIGADLSNTNLSGAKLWRADLSGTDLSGADLSYTNLSSANLSGTKLRRANLREANLSGASLDGADLSEAHLEGTNVTGADLDGASLKDATGITIEELEKMAKSLKGATMPDGSLHP